MWIFLRISKIAVSQNDGQSLMTYQYSINTFAPAEQQFYPYGQEPISAK